MNISLSNNWFQDWVHVSTHFLTLSMLLSFVCTLSVVIILFVLPFVSPGASQGGHEPITLPTLSFNTKTQNGPDLESHYLSKRKTLDAFGQLMEESPRHY